MKNKQVIKAFILDQLGLLAVVLGSQIIFFGTLFYIKDLFLEEILYFSFLVFVILCVYLGIRFYKRGRVYEKFLLTSENLSDYLIIEPRSVFEENYNQMMEEIIKINNQQEINKKADKKLQKVMVYRFVHQMKTPLSVLKLICENHQEEKDYRKIERNINTLQYNLNQMLEVYRLEEFKNDFVSEKVLLNTLCKESINALKDFFIISEVYPKLEIEEALYVYSDSKWLKLILHQLLTNAIKYSDKTKTVTIRARKEGEQVILAIIDQGVGIEKADRSHLFELFYIGKNGRNTADSSGMGLYIVKKVADYLGHEIVFSSEVGKGSTFMIKFNNG